MTRNNSLTMVLYRHSEWTLVFRNVFFNLFLYAWFIKSTNIFIFFAKGWIVAKT